MDPDQLEKRLAWLDEQRLKDAETIRQLTKTVESLESAQAALSKQLQTVSEENSKLAVQAARLHQVDDTLAKHRKEVAKQMEIAESRRSEKEKHLETLRKTEQKGISKQVETLKMELSRIRELEEALETRREEQIRLNSDLDGLTKKYDKVESEFQETQIQFKSIQESQQKEHKQLGDLENELAEVKRRAVGTRTELEGLADDVRRVDVRTSEAAAAEDERSQAQAVFFERQDLKLVEFDKAWASWEERFEEFERDAATIKEKVISYDETFRAALKIQDTLEGLMERIERRITEVSEMQRLAEDRLKQDWNSVQAEDHKRWNTFKLTNDEHWRDHDRSHIKLHETMASLEKTIASAAQDLSAVREHDESRVRELVVMIREWASEIERSKR